jgi:hypothetical protein
VRRLAVSLAIVLTLAAPAAGASNDPRAYVLGQVDVPKGFELSEENSLLLTAGMLVGDTDEASKLLRRAGFQGAYLAGYINAAPPHWKFLHTGAFLFRTAAGARTFVRSTRSFALGPFPARGRRLDLGDEAWTRSTSSPDDATAVVWRYQRIVAYVVCSDMSGHRRVAQALARKQQRRIAATLG